MVTTCRGRYIVSVHYSHMSHLYGAEPGIRLPHIKPPLSSVSLTTSALIVSYPLTPPLTPPYLPPSVPPLVRWMLAQLSEQVALSILESGPPSLSNGITGPGSVDGSEQGSIKENMDNEKNDKEKNGGTADSKMISNTIDKLNTMNKGIGNMNKKFNKDIDNNVNEGKNEKLSLRAERRGEGPLKGARSNPDSHHGQPGGPLDLRNNNMSIRGSDSGDNNNSNRDGSSSSSGSGTRWNIRNDSVAADRGSRMDRGTRRGKRRNNIITPLVPSDPAQVPHDPNVDPL